MAGDLIRFVDSLVASPTTRLDLNDETSWWVRSFSAPPPRLRRSVANNAMRDGVNVGSSSYDARTLTIEVECRKSTQDLAATEIQKLWRELDRPNNFLMYQPTGATKPVFFRTYRSDTSQMADVMAQAAMRTFTLELLAEPFALGLKEALGPYAINNNPASGSLGCYVDISGVLGDVPAQLLYWDTGGINQDRILGVTHASATPTLLWSQAESMTMGNSTSNPGGAADATMSGGGSTNYALTTFSGSAVMTTRLEWNVGSAAGSYRAIAFVRRTGVTSTLTARVVQEFTGATGGTVTVPSVLTRQVLDLGIVDLPGRTATTVGAGSASNAATSNLVQFHAARSGGTDQLQWDLVLMIPVGDQPNEVAAPSLLRSTSVRFNTLLDGASGTAAAWSGTDPSAGTAQIGGGVMVSGGFPVLTTGGSVNRVIVIPKDAAGASALASITTVYLAYWPCYLFVRPVSS